MTITKTATLERIPVGERLRAGDWWLAQWGWERLGEEDVKGWFGNRKVTKDHVACFRVVGIKYDSLRNE